LYSILFAKYNKNNNTYLFWQQDRHPIELQTPKWINEKLAYIHLNQFVTVL